MIEVGPLNFYEDRPKTFIYALRRSFKMTVKRNYTIVIDTISRLLNNHAPVFLTSKNHIFPREFSTTLSKLQVIAKNSNWFIALFSGFVIGRSKHFGIGFSTVIWNPLE